MTDPEGVRPSQPQPTLLKRMKEVLDSLLWYHTHESDHLLSQAEFDRQFRDTWKDAEDIIQDFRKEGASKNTSGSPSELVKTLDQALVFGLAALGDTDSVLELGHFGEETRRDALKLLKQARERLKPDFGPHQP